MCDVALRLLRINSPDSGWTLCDSIDYSRSGGGGADVLRPPAPHTHEALAKKRKQVCELAIAGINSPRLRLNLRRTLCDSGQKIPVHRATGPFALRGGSGVRFLTAPRCGGTKTAEVVTTIGVHPRCVLVLHSALLAATSEVFAPLQDPTLDALRCDFTAHTAAATTAHCAPSRTLPQHLLAQPLTTLQPAARTGVLLQV